MHGGNELQIHPCCSQHCALTPVTHTLLNITHAALFHPQDEVFSHRLGLVPLAINPDRINWKNVEDPTNETNTVVFKMDITCRREQDGTLVNDKGEQHAGDQVGRL